eukprot:SAG11_NODE_12879_length_681_cov_1.530928_1_plen_186_part_10
MLKEQYRMDPCICHLVSQFGYRGQLRTNAAVSRARRHERILGHAPLQFHDCADGEERHPPGGGRSFMNMAEAERVEQLYLIERQLSLTSTILVEALYGAQVEAISRLLIHYGDPNLIICTVDKAQGSEAAVVILSCVRSTRVTQFGADRNRMIVALSRAQNRLHIVGHRETLEASRNWRAVLSMI